MDVAMESEETQASVASTVTGKIVALAGGFGFLTFQGQIVEGSANCYFRGHRLFQDGKKIKPSEVKTHGRLKELFDKKLKDAQATAVITPLKEKAVFTTNEGEKIEATFYSHCVWLDATVPPEEEHIPKAKEQNKDQSNGDNDKEEGKESSPAPMEAQSVASALSVLKQEVMTIANKEGIMMFRSLPRKGFLGFEFEGRQEYAVFDHSQLFIDGRPVELREFISWPRLSREIVRFHADRLQHIHRYHSFIMSDDGQKAEFNFPCNWACSAVWIGPEPTADQIQERADTDFTPVFQNSEEERKYRELVRSSEYISGKVVTLLDRHTGVIASNNKKKGQGSKDTKYVLFKMQDLYENGVKVQVERLSEVVPIGFVLCCLCKPLIPSRRVADMDVTLTAVQAWKGRRMRPSAADKMETGAKSKIRLPSPVEATHFGRSGKVVLLEDALGLAQLETRVGGRGQKVLFVRQRHFNQNGQLSQLPLADTLSLGDSLNFDMIKADQNEAYGEYEWVSVLNWTGSTKPGAHATGLLIKAKDTMSSYRGRLVMLESAGNLGANAGLIQITGGPDQTKINQRVFFSSEQTYVFGLCMARGDLRHVLEDNEKLQFELVPSTDDATKAMLSQNYGAEIHAIASCVWIGSPPKPDEEFTNQPLRKGTHQWLEKRGMDELFFRRLIKGEVPPKKDEGGARRQVPPSITYVRAVELKKPKAKGQPCVAGTVVVENGPYKGRQGAFTRECVWIHGHHLAKTDLVRVIQPTDRFDAKILEANPTMLTITSMHLGSSRERCRKLNENPELSEWLEKHSMAYADFVQSIDGAMPPAPFFPLPQEIQNGRIVHFYDPSWAQGPTEYGIIKVHQGSCAKKDVLFHRSSVYVWNVSLDKANLSLILKKGERIFCEVTVLTRKERLEWQGKLKTQGIPKMVASLVYVGGGRPKPRENPNGPRMEELAANANLIQWLERRNIVPERFKRIIDGAVITGQPLPAMPDDEASPLVRPAAMAVGDLARNKPPMAVGHLARKQTPMAVGDLARNPTNMRPPYPLVEERPRMPIDGGPRPGPPFDSPGRPLMEEGRHMPPRSLLDGMEGPRRPFFDERMGPRRPLYDEIEGPRPRRPFFDEMEGRRPERRLMEMAHGDPHRPMDLDRERMMHDDRQPPPPREREPVNPLNVAENPIWSQAKEMLGRVMQCPTPTDPGVRNVVRSGAELRLAEFVAATLQASITQFKESSRRLPFPDDWDPRDEPRSLTSSLSSGPVVAAIGEERRQMREMEERRMQQQRQQQQQRRVTGQGLYGLERPLLDDLPPSSITADRKQRDQSSSAFEQSWYSDTASLSQQLEQQQQQQMQEQQQQYQQRPIRRPSGSSSSVTGGMSPQRPDLAAGEPPSKLYRRKFEYQ